MKAGSVVIDCASEAGGNCESTVPGELYESPNGVKVVGYTDLNSRMASQSSMLFSNNITKLLLSMVNKENHYIVNFKDEVVRGSVVTHQGEMMWPDPNPTMLDVKKTKAPKVVKEIVEKTPFRQTLETSLYITGAMGAILGAGVLCPQAPF